MSAQPTTANPIIDAVRRVRTSQSTTTVGDALTSVSAIDLGRFLHATFSDTVTARQLLTTGSGASPGAASGVMVLTAEDAISAADEGRAVILVRRETQPDDVLGMQSARGIITAHGGLASHAAVVARGWGIPAVVGASEMVIEAGGIRVGERRISAGTELSIDGRTGEVFLGSIELTTTEAPQELTVLLEWADLVCRAATPPIAIRANAETGADALHARQLGATGIGLCRTEHMFLADDRLPLVRRFILTEDAEVEREALLDLERVQRQDFEEILLAMDGLPVTVRLLDPPLHEFLPDLERLIVSEALGTLTTDDDVELAALRRLRETNPMIGTRGVRLGVVKPGLYEMQVRALCRALAEVSNKGGSSRVEVMVPLVVDAREMQLARRWIDRAMSDVGLVGHHRDTLRVGAMVETPRAAVLAGELAGVSEFLSFGTNDLTQLTFGFSRDDVGSRLLPLYLAEQLLDADPFEVLDQVAVGRLVRDACSEARRIRPDITLGVCGEHAGDPDSARFFVECGIDYLSCSPYRVPVARLAVAQALIASGRVSEESISTITRDVRAAASTHHAESHIARIERSDAAPHRASLMDTASEFAVLHALRVKGLPTTDAVLETLGPGQTEHALRELAAAGLVRHLASRDVWQLLDAGRARHEELLPVVSGAEILAALREPYSDFLELNAAFKSLCAAWQLRNDAPNDHSDAAYDAARVDELCDLHTRADAVLCRFAQILSRFQRYRPRLYAALARTSDGDVRMFTGVLCGSYHDVWMELHEDLVQLLGVDRHDEGSY